MRRPSPHHSFGALTAYLRRMSIKRRITFAMLLTFLLTIPSVSLSLLYFSHILVEINTIIDQDVALGRTAANLSVMMLDIRRNERNYRLLGGDTERDAVHRLIAETGAELDSANVIASDQEQFLVRAMQSHLTMYENSFGMLTEHISAHPPEDRIQRIRSQLAAGLSMFQVQYRDVLEQLETAPPSQRDSLISEISESMNAISFDRLVATTPEGNDSTQPAYIQTNLNTSSQEFLDAASRLADLSWQNMQEHRMDSQHIEARAKRNIITILLLTAMICVYVVSTLPKKIIRPVTRLNGLLKKAGEGDFQSHATASSNDEIGDLAHSYNQVLDRINNYDELKTRKIASQKRIIDRLLENLSMPVCILSANMVLLYYNERFTALFGGAIPAKPPDTGLEIEKFESLKSFAEQLQQEIANAGSEFAFTYTQPDNQGRQFRGRLIRNALMKVDSIILLGEMPAPEEDA